MTQDFNTHPDELKLQAFHDGQLSDTEARSIRQHADGCPVCRAQLQALRDSSALFAGLVPPAPPEGFAEKVAAAARASRSEQDTLRLARWLTAAAACLICVAGVGLAMQSTPMPATQNTTRFDPVSTLIVADLATVGQAGSEDRQFAQWVVADLSGRLAMAETVGGGSNHE